MQQSCAIYKTSATHPFHLLQSYNCSVATQIIIQIWFWIAYFEPNIRCDLQPTVLFCAAATYKLTHPDTHLPPGKGLLSNSRTHVHCPSLNVTRISPPVSDRSIYYPVYVKPRRGLLTRDFSVLKRQWPSLTFYCFYSLLSFLFLWHLFYGLPGKGSKS